MLFFLPPLIVKPITSTICTKCTFFTKLMEVKMAVTRIKSGEARIKWRDLLDQVFSSASDIIIERSGKDVAVLLPAADYAAIRDVLDELRLTRSTSAAYAEWKRDPSVARSWKEVEAELVQKGLIAA
jgi:prevent-host-death family protein